MYLAQEWMDKQNHSMGRSIEELDLMAERGEICRHASNTHNRIDYAFKDTSVIAWRIGRSLEVL